MKTSSLQQRLFVWFGVAILLTGIGMAAAFAIVGRVTDSGWPREIGRVKTFTGNMFAAVWDDEDQRNQLATRVAEDLEVEVTLFDEQGQLLARFGPDCEVHRTWHSDVPGRGSVRICAERKGGGPLKLVIPLTVVGVIMWLSTIWVARALTRPLTEVARVAQAVGDGDFEARPRMHRRAPREVVTLSASITDMAERIQRQMEDQRVLLAAVSHELRTPLGHLRLLTELAKTDPEALEQMEREVDEIDELVGQLLVKARLEFTVAEMRPFDPAELGREALRRKGLDPGLLVLETERAGEGDLTLLSRALANLVDNAERHGQGLTALRISEDGGKLAFLAEDQGPGIAATEASGLFELFRPGTSEHGNLGLGLALVHKIAEAHGGNTIAQDRSGGGARIGLAIPLKSRSSL